MTSGGTNFNYFSESLISIFNKKNETGDLGSLSPLFMPLHIRQKRNNVLHYDTGSSVNKKKNC